MEGAVFFLKKPTFLPDEQRHKNEIETDVIVRPADSKQAGYWATMVT